MGNKACVVVVVVVVVKIQPVSDLSVPLKSISIQNGQSQILLRVAIE